MTDNNQTKKYDECGMEAVSSVNEFPISEGDIATFNITVMEVAKAQKVNSTEDAKSPLTVDEAAQVGKTSRKININGIEIPGASQSGPGHDEANRAEAIKRSAEKKFYENNRENADENDLKDDGHEI